MNGVKKLVYRQLKKMTFLPSDMYVRYLYEYFTGKKLNLKNPIEFNEKIQWMKVYFRPAILTKLVDKYEVRSFVEERIGKQYLNELYGVYHKPEDIDFDALPEKFVIKGVHASSYNLIVEDKSKLNRKKAIKLFKKWLRTNQYYRTGQEWAYKNVVPKLSVEKFLKEDGQSSLIDYKFYCFNGEVDFVEVHLDRAEKHTRGFWDLEFNKLPFRYVSSEKSIHSDVEKPDNFDEMIELSKKLSEGFPFVRVDFYSVNGKTIFGEMTFYPSDGRKDFIPDEYNEKIGARIKLPKIPEGKKEITDFENLIYD